MEQFFRMLLSVIGLINQLKHRIILDSYHVYLALFFNQLINFPIEVIMNTAIVTPKSNKAKNRFANLMDKNQTCIVEQIKDNLVFLRSLNGKNFFWVNLLNDSDWSIKL